MPALWIAHVTVTDEDAYGKYAKLAGPAIAKHGGHFIARGGRYVQLEGQERARNVVARFPALKQRSSATTAPITNRRSTMRATPQSANLWLSK